MESQDAATQIARESVITELYFYGAAYMPSSPLEPEHTSVYDRMSDLHLSRISLDIPVKYQSSPQFQPQGLPMIGASNPMVFSQYAPLVSNPSYINPSPAGYVATPAYPGYSAALGFTVVPPHSPKKSVRVPPQFNNRGRRSKKK
jgi:hypothetical protein